MFYINSGLNALPTSSRLSCNKQWSEMPAAVAWKQRGAVSLFEVCLGFESQVSERCLDSDLQPDTKAFTQSATAAACIMNAVIECSIRNDSAKTSTHFQRITLCISDKSKTTVWKGCWKPGGAQNKSLQPQTERWMYIQGIISAVWTGSSVRAEVLLCA